MKSPKVTPIQQPVGAVVYTGTVLSCEERQYVVDLGGMHCPATACFSCIVRPLVDDVVLCVLSDVGDYYITGIIERQSSQAMSVEFPGDVNIQSLNGSLGIMASDSVSLAAAKSINSVSDEVFHKSNKAFVDYDQLAASGSNAQVSFSTIRIFSQLINTISRQVLQKFKNYVRHSEESDLIKAGNMTRKVQGLYAMDSEHTIMLSKKDTKIDGERIHMG